MLKGQRVGKEGKGSETVVRIAVTADVYSAQSLIQGHLAESETATTPQEIDTSAQPTKTSASETPVGTTKTVAKVKDCGGAWPKTKEPAKGKDMVRGYASLF